MSFGSETHKVCTPFHFSVHRNPSAQHPFPASQISLEFNQPRAANKNLRFNTTLKHIDESVNVLQTDAFSSNYRKVCCK